MRKLAAITGICLAVLFMGVLAGCIITNVKGFTDNDYQGYRLKHMVVRAPNANFMFGDLLEKSMVVSLQARGIDAQSFMDMFPPTRKWTNEQITSELTGKGFDTIMYVNLVGSGEKSETVGYINTGNAFAYGNSTSFNSVSVPVIGRSRFTATRITVYDVATARTIWIADSNTKAGGAAFVGDKTQTDDIAKEVIKTLAESGHL